MQCVRKAQAATTHLRLLLQRTQPCKEERSRAVDRCNSQDTTRINATIRQHPVAFWNDPYANLAYGTAGPKLYLDTGRGNWITLRRPIGSLHFFSTCTLFLPSHFDATFFLCRTRLNFGSQTETHASRNGVADKMARFFLLRFHKPTPDLGRVDDWFRRRSSLRLRGGVGRAFRRAATLRPCPLRACRAAWCPCRARGAAGAGWGGGRC